MHIKEETSSATAPTGGLSISRRADARPLSAMYRERLGHPSHHFDLHSHYTHERRFCDFLSRKDAATYDASIAAKDSKARRDVSQLIAGKKK